MRYSDWGQAILAGVVSSGIITGLFYIYQWAAHL